jgi:hypothetical protein
MKFLSIITSVMVLLPAALAMAQQATPESSPPMQMQSPAATSPSAEQGNQQMQKMDKMADSVTKMSEMCQMMMKKEMAFAPYVMAAGITVGILLYVALVLFVILEVQWIIYWCRLLKAQKRDGQIEGR